MDIPPSLYPIRDLVLLPELNPRAQLCEETIIRYMESFEALPPVSVQEGTGVLVDGFHRVEAATRLGVEAVPVRLLDIPDEELHLYAGLSNSSHGRAMSRGERNRFVVRLVEEYEWPVDKVARTVGVSTSSVNLAVRENRYNRELSERLGEEVQVINSSHVQALYRVGDEQRLQLMDAVAGKTDAEGRPRPLTGAELKILVDLMEDPTTPAGELQRLLADPLTRPEPPARRRANGASGRPLNGGYPEPDDASEAARESAPRNVERYGPLSGPGADGLSRGELRAELLERAMAPPDSEPTAGGRRSGTGANEDGRRSRKTDGDSTWREEAEPSWEEEEYQPLRSESPRPAPLGLDRANEWGNVGEAASSVAVMERVGDERRPADALREAERLLCDLCTRVEDGELWEEIRTVRDLVREAVDLMA